ncbi:hypothetical protein GALL_534500 [mine drainage metagenome]|uniref:Uncharacterized protein n=1 Tax=mine drainage metagenome TaxID=410659 RepID=A0A1J5P2V9_9ZZZZ
MLDDVLPRRGVTRQEAHGHGVTAGGRQGFAMVACPIVQQCIRHLNQDSGAIANQRVSPDGAAMIQILEDFQALRDDIVRFSALDIHDEAHAARIVLVPGIVKALSHNLLHSHNFPWRNMSAVRGRAFKRKQPFCPLRGQMAMILPHRSVGELAWAIQEGCKAALAPNVPGKIAGR